MIAKEGRTEFAGCIDSHIVSLMDKIPGRNDRESDLRIHPKFPPNMRTEGILKLDETLQILLF